ncbi:MAG: SPOR domain-containing protein [Nitrospinae bacterium]|nr:SPOR domain-containing protein [Nitrospinota bacterium]
MGGNEKKGGKSPGVLLTGKQVAVLFGAIAAIAGVTFLAGYLSGGVVKQNAPETPVKAGQQEEESQFFGGAVTPKKLDADSIIKERELEKEARPQQFTFTKTLSSEQAPAATAQPARQEKAEPVRDVKQDEPKVSALVKKNDPAKPAAEAKEAAKQEKPKKEATPAKNAKEPAAKPKQAAEAKAPSSASGAKKPEAKTFTVQVGSFPSKAEAEKLSARLAAKNHNAFIQPFANKGTTWYRVRVGSYRTEPAAARAAEKLKSDEKVSTFVTSN